MVWLRLCGFFLRYHFVFCLSLLLRGGRGAAGPVSRREPRAAVPCPGSERLQGSAAPRRTRGRWRHPRQCKRGSRRLPAVRASVRAPGEPSWLPARQVALPEPWRDPKYLLLARVNVARKLTGCAAFSPMKDAANSHQFLDTEILHQPSFWLV